MKQCHNTAKAAAAMARVGQSGSVADNQVVPDLLAVLKRSAERAGQWMMRDLPARFRSDASVQAGILSEGHECLAPVVSRGPRQPSMTEIAPPPVMGPQETPDLTAGGPGENVEIGEVGIRGKGRTESHSTFSTLSPSLPPLEAAIYPANSWLARYMDYARQREESADSYLLGSILPVVAATLARRVGLAWGDGQIFPNLFAMLAGKPGDRKSAAVNLAEKVARSVIAKQQFLPDIMSAEALVDEYDERMGGSPDKLLLVDDANAFLGMLHKSNFGERVGQMLLRLYDCKGLVESFRRNQQGKESTPRRCIPETSTSLVLGATFNLCQFHGHEIRSGLQRRFLYYLAEGHGRFIAIPTQSDAQEFGALCARLARLTKLQCVPLRLSPDAEALWTEFQKLNRRRLADAGCGPTNDACLARLNGQPNHVLKISLIFQATLWLETSAEPPGWIEAPTLHTAIQHSEHCLAAAQALDNIANRAQIQQGGDVLLANLFHDFGRKSVKGEIQLTRTELTRAYAHHSGRKGTLTPDDLYLRLIPDLVRRGKAREISRPGKQPAFAFRADECSSPIQVKGK